MIRRCCLCRIQQTEQAIEERLFLLVFCRVDLVARTYCASVCRLVYASIGPILISLAHSPLTTPSLTFAACFSIVFYGPNPDVGRNNNCARHCLACLAGGGFTSVYPFLAAHDLARAGELWDSATFRAQALGSCSVFPYCCLSLCPLVT